MKTYLKGLLNRYKKYIIIGVLIILIIISFIIGYSIGISISDTFLPVEPSVFDLLDRIP